MIGWLETGEAEDFFELYPGGTTFIASEDYEAFLNLAYIRLSNDPNYSFPDTPTEKMKNAQCEFAFSLSEGGGGASLKAQGITNYRVGNFSVSFEDSKGLDFLQYPIPVQNYLSDYLIGPDTTFTINRKIRRI